jgi:3-methyladenine DNA glycosylase Mpg
LTRHATGGGDTYSGFRVAGKLSWINCHDLLSDDFFIAAPDEPETFTIVKRPRVGVAYAGAWAKRLLRFYIKGNPFVSRP